MNRNVEIKAHLRDPNTVEAKASSLSGTPPQVLDQEDTFFEVPTGRLKLRVFSPEEGELISYHRPNATGPKLSQYAIHPTADPESLRRVLAATLETLGVVRKRRLVYLVGQTRVHLDHVEGLGHFLELEVVLRPDQTDEDGEEEARRLLKALGIPESDLVSGAYLDLLLSGAKSRGSQTVPDRG